MGYVTQISATERAILFKKRLKFYLPCSLNNGERTSNADVSEPNDIATEADTHTFVDDISELMDIKISRLDAMQDQRLIDCTFTRHTDLDRHIDVALLSLTSRATMLDKIVTQY